MNFLVHAASYRVTAARQSLTFRRDASTNGSTSLKITRARNMDARIAKG